MTALALIVAAVAGLLHVLFFTLESLRWREPKTWKTFGLTSQEDADTTASLAYNQGFYNLFLAVGTFVGIAVVAWSDTRDTIGWTLIVFACGSMLAAALVLISTGASYARAAAIQGVPALVALVTGLLAANA
jgi:putative membrane protein